jgi:hypothetical protein
MKFKIKKKTRKKLFRIFLFLLAFTVLFSAGFSVYLAIKIIPNLDKVEMHKSNDKFFWAEYFYVKEASGIWEEVPKGLIVSDSIDELKESASLLKAISEIYIPKKIIVISEVPNVSGFFVCKKCRFYDVKGRINIDKDLANELSKSPIFEANDSIFQSENNLKLFIPILRNFFSDSLILPILVGENTENDALISFKNLIKEKSPKEILIVSGIQFSEDQNLALRTIDNRSSKRTIEHFDFDNIKSLSLNANTSFSAFLHLVQAYDLKKPIILDNYKMFFEGEIEKNRGTTVLAFGNVAEDFSENVIRGFTFDEDYNVKTDLTSFRRLKDIRGKNDSFLVGPDYLFFNSKNNSCNRFTQNEFSISFCKVREDEENLDLISNEKDNADFLITLLSYKDREFTEEKKVFARKLTQLGADVVIGRGISEVLPAELYSESVIFYSLGDFLPESRFFTELNMNLEGAILAMDISESQSKIFVLGVDVFAGFPSFSSEEKSLELFKKIISEFSQNKSTNLKYSLDLKEASFTLNNDQ